MDWRKGIKRVLCLAGLGMLLVACQDSNPATESGPLAVPRASLSVSQASKSGFQLRWKAAQGGTGNLTYEVYLSPFDDINSAAEMKANGFLQGSTGKTSLSLTDLSSGTSYYVNLLVRDEAGAELAYEVTTAETDSESSQRTSQTSDSTAPTSPSISIADGAARTASSSLSITLAAEDAVGVTGYYLSTSASQPQATASGWTAISSSKSYSATVTHSLANASSGTTRLYVWFKDANGNVSSSATDSIILDLTAPTAGGSGAISFSNWSYAGQTLSWTSASDDLDAASDLSYKVVMATSSASIDTTAEVSALSGGSVISDWTSNLGSVSVTGLGADATYYFAVAVKDQAGNMTLYSVTSDSRRYGLVAYYPFSGDSQDYSGNANHLTSSSYPTLTTDRNGNASSAYSFTAASGQYLLAAHSTSLANTQYSQSLWFTDSGVLAENSIAFLVSKGFTYYEIHLLTQNNLYVIPTMAYGSSSFQIYNQSFTTGTWYHLVITFDGTNLYTYLNGSLLTYASANNMTGMDDPGLSTGSLNLGRRSDGSWYHDGKIDDVRFYNRALTAAEVTDLYGE